MVSHTGGLGSSLLSQLINPAVERVYALSRPSSTSIEERQMQSTFVALGVSVVSDPLSSGNLIYVETEASQDNCGGYSPIFYEVLIHIILCPLR